MPGSLGVSGVTQRGLSVADRPLQHLARPDHGAFAAEVLLHPEAYVGQRIELASDAPTPAEMATTLGNALGREVHHERVRLESIGNPDMHAMWTFPNGPGYQVDVTALHAAHPEIGWTSFADWAQHTFGDMQLAQQRSRPTPARGWSTMGWIRSSSPAA